MAGDVYRELGEAAWAWVAGQVRGDDGPWLPAVVSIGEGTVAPGADRDSLYAGIAGLAPLLAEIGQCRALTAAEQALAAGIVARLSATAVTRAEPSLYDGLAGDVTALKLLAPGRERVALARLVELMIPEGWPSTLGIEPEPAAPGTEPGSAAPGTEPELAPPDVESGSAAPDVEPGSAAPGAKSGSAAPVTDLVCGSAGVVLAAVWAGGEGAADVAAGGGEALLRAADQAEGGLDWGMRPGSRSRHPNYSHGTAGVATALAVAGAALGRADFITAARDGAGHLLAVGRLDDDGFIVPRSLPHSRRDMEPVTYTWCHGPAGTSQLFAALAHAGVDQVAGYEVARLRRLCLNAILASGVPRRLRPGFWDNDGRCCGTAGVGDVLLDAAQDCTDPREAAQLLEAARTMADALVERAIRGPAGACWRFTEHRQDPPLLPPGTSWMQGAAGIAAFLLRLARVVRDGLAAPVVDRPDQWWAVPARLRTVHGAQASPDWLGP